jgi:hypothetical protein
VRKAKRKSKNRTLENFVNARKLLMSFFSAAKLILLVDVRGEETFARKGCGTRRREMPG